MKDYNELTFTDDFLFCKILQNNPELCRELTGLILARKVGKIVDLSKQLPIEITADGKGVRFDIYFEDDTSAMYDIEMQVITKKELPKRARYYQGMLDLARLERGHKYDELPHSTIIFICLDDAFGKDMIRYTFRNRCVECDELYMDDGTEKVFICANNSNGKVSQDLKMFCNYISGNSYCENDLISRIKAEVDAAIGHQKWRAEYMTLAEKYEEQREIGENLGKMRAYIELIEQYAVNHSCTIDAACEELGVDVHDYYAYEASLKSSD